MGRSSIERGLMLASVSGDFAPDLPLGLRNDRVLALRERLAGPVLEALASCPACGSTLECTLGTDLLRAAAVPLDGTATLGDFEVEYRLPNSLDLAYALRFASAVEAAEALARRCVIRAWQGDREISAEALPTGTLEALGDHLDQIDPAAVPSLGLTCSDCGHAWTALFDVADFVWRELAVAARRALLEVHELARAYGWTEGEVLRLSPTRRKLYLGMVRA